MRGQLRNQLRSASGWLHHNLIFPGIVRARGEGALFHLLRELQRIQWEPEARLRQRQAHKLKAMLDHASTRSTFYKDAWSRQQAFDVQEVWDQLQALPLIGKADLQHSQEHMLARPLPRRVTHKTTGGSTGQAVTVVKDRHALAAERAASWLAYGWFGIRMGDLGVRFWGTPVTWKRRALYTVTDVAVRRMRFSAFAFDDTDLDRYWRRCVAARPSYFYGYVSMVVALAQRVIRAGTRESWPELKAVITTAEVLTEPQRQLLTEAFGVPVQNEYGCGEVGPIAYECPDGSMHLMTESQVVEVLKPDGSPARAGETGEIVLTDLNNRAMPLVRYRVGDLAVPGQPCVCGRGFPVLERVWGREYDLVESPDGRRYHGEFFMYLFEDLRARDAGVDQFQVIQTGSADLVIKLVYSDSNRRETVDVVIREEMRQRLPAMKVSLQRVDRILPKPSGKTSVVENQWAREGSPSTSPGTPRPG